MKSIDNKITIDLTKELKNIINKDKQYIIPIFIPHFGCNNECVFCNQKKISGQTKIQNFDQIKEDIERHLSYIKEKDNIQIAFFGGSFTGIPVSHQIKYLKLANEFIKKGMVKSIRISTRPDYITIPILKMLKKYNVKTIELGVQSMDNTVLEASKRGHTKTDVIKAAIIINLMEIDLGFQIMIGLPKSNITAERNTIYKLLKYKPKILRIYPVYVLEESELHNMYMKGEYLPLDLNDAAKRTAEIIKDCGDSNVQIIRIGLQSTDEITISNKKIIGPISDNFAEYALAFIVRERLEKEIINNLDVYNVNKTNKQITLIVDKRYISIAIGPKRINRDYLENKYDIKLKIKGE